MRIRVIVAAAAAIALPAAAPAATLRLHYTTFADGVFPASTVDALLTTDDGAFYGAPGQLVTGIGGARDGVTIIGLADDFSEVFYPGSPIVDMFGITFTAGGRDYNFYSDGTFYHEYSYLSGDFGNQGEGRLILDRDVSLTAVPEPASWALMIAGFALAGTALRRRRERADEALA